MSSTTILPWGGGELSSFDPLTTSSFIESTVGMGGDWDPNYARCCIYANPGGYGTSPTWPAASTFWLHFNLRGGATNGPTNCRTISFYQTGTEVARLVSTSGPYTNGITWILQTLQSGVLTSTGSFTIPAANVFGTYDIKIVAGGTGSAQMYSSGTLVINANNLAHSFSGVDQVQICGIGTPFNGGDAFWSEIIADSLPHIGDRLYTYPINTLSAFNNGWVGGVGNVNEIQINDANFVYTASPNVNDSFYASGLNLGSANIVSVIVALRINCGPSGPQNCKVLLRTGGTNFLSSTIGVSNGFQATTWSWNNNPNTGTQWLASDAQAVEGGMQSIS